MNRYTIIHAKKGNFFAEDIKESDCKEVAVINAKNLEDVFRKTQNIDSSWLKGESVVTAFEQQARSTSVGDIIKDGASGVYAMVENMGFQEVELQNGIFKKA